MIEPRNYRNVGVFTVSVVGIASGGPSWRGQLEPTGVLERGRGMEWVLQEPGRTGDRPTSNGPEQSLESKPEPAPTAPQPAANGPDAHAELVDADIWCRSNADASTLRKAVKDAGYSYGLLMLGCTVRGVTQAQFDALLIPAGRTGQQQKAAS